MDNPYTLRAEDGRPLEWKRVDISDMKTGKRILFTLDRDSEIGERLGQAMNMDFICSVCGKDLQMVEFFSVVPFGGRNSGRAFCRDCWAKEKTHGND